MSIGDWKNSGATAFCVIGQDCIDVESGQPENALHELMLMFSSHKSARFLLKVITFGVWVCWCVPESFGSCGDYLHTRHGGPDSTKQASDVPGQTAHTDGDAAAGNSQAPCSGPECRRGNLPLDVPPLAIVVDGHDRAVNATSVHNNMPEPGDIWKHQPRHAAVAGFRTRLDRPPQC